MHRFHLAALALALVLGASVAACSSSDAASPSGSNNLGLSDGGATTSTSSLPCDVDAILQQNCQSCHSNPPKFGAPVPLVTWDDLQASQMYETVAARVASDANPMPPSPSPRLSAADQKTLADWAAAGAPKGTVSCGTTADAGSGDPSLELTCTPDKTFAPATPYAMPSAAGDQYVCWGVDVTADTPTHIIGFAPKIDNTKIVHHLVMYEAPDSYSPTPTPCDAGASITWRAMYAWAPGVKALELPPEAGFPVSSTGTHYVVQMHYSNPQGLAGETDATSFAVCTSAPRQYEADVLAFGTQSIDIPAAPPAGGEYTRDCSLTLTDTFAGLHFFTALPHMHKLGVAMTTTLTPAGSTTSQDLGNMPNFDFNTQQWLPLNVTSSAGDVVRTKCSWKNTTGEEVKFGETTADEMCYSFTMYYPRITSTTWSWAAPAFLSSCTTD